MSVTARHISTIGMTARDLLLAMDPLHAGPGCTAVGKQLSPRTVTVACACGAIIVRNDDHLAQVGVSAKAARAALRLVPEMPS